MNPLEFVRIDICRKIKLNALGRSYYFMHINDDFKTIWIYFLNRGGHMSLKLINGDNS